MTKMTTTFGCATVTVAALSSWMEDFSGEEDSLNAHVIVWSRSGGKRDNLVLVARGEAERLNFW